MACSSSHDRQRPPHNPTALPFQKTADPEATKVQLIVIEMPEQGLMPELPECLNA